MRQVRRIFIALAVLCLLPLGCVLVAATIAALAGCELNEASTPVCSIAGVDVGGVLSPMFVMGWMALITLPGLLAILVVWALVEAWANWRARRKDRMPARADLEE
ncbi:MAG TPA: hypothetical protein PKD49_02080 [Hyphomicrobium sp.]|nr:hypothetical protein [Hyphomicrobium sp.]